MPARSLMAQPDEGLKSEIASLKQHVSSLDNANNKLSMELGAAQKEITAYGRLKKAHEELQNGLARVNAENSRLKADVDSARSAGARDSETLDAAKQLADAVRKLVG